MARTMGNFSCSEGGEEEKEKKNRKMHINFFFLVTLSNCALRDTEARKLNHPTQVSYGKFT